MLYLYLSCNPSRAVSSYHDHDPSSSIYQRNTQFFQAQILNVFKSTIQHSLLMEMG